MSGKRVRICAAVIGILLLVAADQYVKHIAATVIREKEVIRLIPGVISLTYVENTGAAFGVLAGGQVLLFALTALLLLVVGFVYLRLLATDYTALRVLCVMIIAGGIGNMADRLRLGYVIDMIWFTPVNFPVFNLADCYITVSAFLFLLLLVTKYNNIDFDFLRRK